MLQRIHIENFKSLKNVTLDLQPVNLLIGPNNSGKSNLLKALEFLGKSFIKYEFDDFQQLTYSHRKDLKIKITHSNLTDRKDFFDKIVIENFTLEINFLNKKIGEYFTNNEGNLNIQENPILFIFSEDYIKNVEENANENEYSNTFKNLKKKFNIPRIYNTNINSLLKPYPILPNEDYVENNASNLVAFLDILRDKYRDNFEAIEQDLQICIPEFSRIQLENVPATDDLIKLYGDKTFKRLGLYNAQQKITYWADELSEGTLYFLALLCIIHQPIPPKLLLLEEPEKGIHPRRIKEVVDFIFDLAREKDIQVIMTTHHPYVVNEFQDIPEAVFIFDKDEEGATQIRNLQHDIIEPSDKENDEKGLPHIKFTQDLAEHWVLGFMGGVPK